MKSLVSAYSGLKRSEEHTSELQSHLNLVCRLLLEKKNILMIISESSKGIITPLVLHRTMQCTFACSAAFSVWIAYSGFALFLFFFFNDTATTEIYTLSLHDALPIARGPRRRARPPHGPQPGARTRR